MSKIIQRDSLMLVLGFAISYVLAWFGAPGIVLGLAIPFVLVMWRVSRVQYPDPRVPLLRRLVFQVLLAMALVALFIYDLMITAITMEKDPPVAVVVVAGALGLAYMLLSLAAWRIGHGPAVQAAD